MAKPDSDITVAQGRNCSWARLVWATIAVWSFVSLSFLAGALYYALSAR